MSRRRWLWVAAGAAALLAVAGGIVVGLKLRSAEDVRGSSTQEFVTTAAQKPKPPPAPGIAWPTWGYTNVRDRAAPYRHRPPYRRLWTFRAGHLLEFPPAVAYGRLYFTNNPGETYALDVETGKVAWRHASGRCTASSPTVAGGVVFQAFLNRPPCNSDSSPSELDGAVVALDARTGKVRWRALLGPTESSPLVTGGLVVVGDWRGDVTALDRRTGKVLWRTATGGRVKGAVAKSGRRLFVGAYDGRLYSFALRTGRLLWRSSSQEGLTGRGTFYSTPAVAYGRVYIGSTDGKVYSFGAASGDLIWSHGTGGYVYSSPAVAQGRVFAGSYSGRLYALDAATGDVAWEVDAGGEISGAPTAMAGLVYVATLAGRTLAVDLRTGKVAWRFPDGKYTPIAADRERVYLVGHTRVYALVPRG
ncbi:MAG TPA: PQQ-binding-like beta-propeller repeat protein [Gaiellaceae bacterium]|nr:PQQ-binding-like beta-propeller repeat protein [Gaiellaceae bacterium]